jgi:predicted ArsR family transcriptional regulator
MDWDPEDDICENRHGGNPESAEAHESIAGGKRAAWNRIMRHLESCGDATCDEMEIALGMRHQSCSARFAELKAEGIIEATGERRPTRSGRDARVFRLRREAEIWDGNGQGLLFDLPHRPA